MNEQKAELRKQVQALLDGLGEAERAARSRGAVARLLAAPEFQHAHAVMAYDSCRTELHTREVLVACLNSGKILALPRTRRRDCSMQAHCVANLEEDLEVCRFGFREPKAELPVLPLAELDLIVVPGLAFDAGGQRLGRGRGYYDRFLAAPERHAAACALAFECQLVDRVPAGSHDFPMDLIVTEDRVLRPQRRTA